MPHLHCAALAVSPLHLDALLIGATSVVLCKEVSLSSERLSDKSLCSYRTEVLSLVESCPYFSMFFMGSSTVAV